MDSSKQYLRDILDAALAAADPGVAVRRALRVEGGSIVVGGRPIAARRVVVAAVGKASVAMARASEDVLGDRIGAGLVVTKGGYEGAEGERAIRRLEVIT